MNLELLISHLAWLGPWLFFIGALAEALPVIGTFLPGATIVTLGGFAAAHGYFSLNSVIIFSIVGAIIGDAISYYAGSYGGNLIRRKKIISESLLQKGENFFYKYGNQSLLWGRFIGPIRSVIPFLAGITKLKAKTFWFWNITSGLLWGFTYVLLGYFSGSLVVVIIKRWSYKLTWLLVPLIIIPLILWLIRHHGEGVKQYFRDHSATFAKRVQNLKFIKKVEARYPAFQEFFIWKSSQTNLYLSFIGLTLLITLIALTFIFDWI